MTILFFTNVLDPSGRRLQDDVTPLTKQHSRDTSN